MEYEVQSRTRLGYLHLGPGSLLRIRDGREMVVYVWSGGIWLTQEGDRADRFIGPGGRFRISSAGVTLISALGGQGSITLTSPDESEFAGRIDLVRTASGDVQPLFAPAPAARPTTAAL